jgi:RecJ-like exonuclease
MGPIIDTKTGPQDVNPGDEAAPGTPGTGEAVCPVCKGSGRLDAGECPNCGGSGKVIRGIGGA